MDSGFEGPGLLPGLPTDGETASRAEELAPDEAELAQQEPQAPEAPLAAQGAAPLTGEPAGHMAAALATMAENLEKLAASAEHYHARAEQRETVISHLHSEVDR